MTATDELRRMLDERGAKHVDDGDACTWWGAWCAEERPSRYGSFVKVTAVLTPKQAIDSTVGPETCHDCLADWEPFECSECHGRDNSHKYPNYCSSCGRKVVIL